MKTNSDLSFTLYEILKESLSSNTTLRYMFAQGRKDGWTNADHYYVTPSLRGGGQKGYTG